MVMFEIFFYYYYYYYFVLSDMNSMSVYVIYTFIDLSILVRMLTEINTEEWKTNKQKKLFWIELHRYSVLLY